MGYTYDAAGRLVGAESVAHPIAYTYNGDGVRVLMDVDGVETRWMQSLQCTHERRVSTADLGLSILAVGIADSQLDGGWTCPVPADRTGLLSPCRTTCVQGGQTFSRPGTLTLDGTDLV